MHHGLAFFHPICFYDAARTDDGYDILIHCRHSIQKFFLHRRDADVCAVQAFALAGFVQTDAQNDHICQFCLCHRFIPICLVGLAAALITGAVADQIQSGSFSHIRQTVQLGRIDHTGACALISGRAYKIADQGDLPARIQRQDAVLIFQQHNAFRCGSFCQLMMCRFIKFLRGDLNGFVRRKCQLQQLIHSFIKGVLAELARFQCFQHPARRAQTRRRHFQRRAVFHALHMVIGTAPVGDDCAIKAPILAQDIQQQVLVFVGVHTVHLIIGGHDGFGMGFPDHDLKRSEIQLPKCTLVQHRVACHAAQLLTVGGKVLGTGGYAVCLNAPDVGSGHLAGEIGVLREILKAASA